MSEAMKPHKELWFDGPNYTADAVIIDSAHEKILLIERSDCGQWALPGGFIDTDEPASVAAQREAAEETSLNVTDGQLVFRGIVDDPRNTERAWIETSAYLFYASPIDEPSASDDARAAAWFELIDLPPLYASHQSIVMRALDTVASQAKLQAPEQATYHRVDGGHMDYGKYFIEATDSLSFLKTHELPNPRQEHLLYLQKEADIMGHLRVNDYGHIPESSYLTETHSLYMEAFTARDGWHWRAPQDSLDTYIQDCLVAFDALEQQPLPSEIYDIAPSIATHHDEGWRILSDDTMDTLTPLISQLRPATQETAERLSSDLTALRQLAKSSLPPTSFAFCHHDARQANIAWHPTHGTRLVDWAWADVGRVGSDATTLLIDLYKHGHDVQQYYGYINPTHCLTMIGFWLEHASWPIRAANNDVRIQQLLSALAAYELLESL